MTPSPPGSATGFSGGTVRKNSDIHIRCTFTNESSKVQKVALSQTFKNVTDFLHHFPKTLGRLTS